jgi:large subunit ribosomal protein L29
MKAGDVHNLKDPELVDRLRQARDEQFNLRLQHATGELENTAHLAESKRDVARLLTVARERGIDVEAELRVEVRDENG